MQIYLVGGAVRDELLGVPVKEKDWVVVGATAEDMIQQGYKQVGKDFPVFLHPKAHEEYALARTERKVAPGYTGFEFNASPQVTLEEDLKRRDLTINAMAKASDGKLIDPYHGADDLKHKILRHVSPAFEEDPVRILRVARFAARFGDFEVAAETNELMKKMVANGEVDALVAERVWKEFERALGEKHPQIFFKVLNDCGALEKLFPMIFETIQAPSFYSRLRRVAVISSDAAIRFSVLMFDYSVEDIDWVCKQYRAPSDYRELALLTKAYYDEFAAFSQLLQNGQEKDEKEPIEDLFAVIDAYRRPDRLDKFLLACQAVDMSKRFQIKKIKEVYQKANLVSAKEFIDQGAQGAEISKQLRSRRIEIIRGCIPPVQRSSSAK